MNELPDNVATLVRTLIVQTRDGHVHWQQTDDRSTSFAYYGQKAGLAVGSVNSDGGHPYVISVLQPDGVREDSWQSWERGALAKDADLFEELYNVAKRSALGTEDADRLALGLLSEITTGAEQS